MATLRRDVRFRHPAEAVWGVISDAGSLASWFPGLTDSSLEGDLRTVTLGSGIPLPERIITNDPLQRRLQYRIEAGPVRHHLGTVDVIDLDDGTCMAVYSTDAEPGVMALVVGAACGNALLELRRQFDDGERTY
ncbi:SRPBCC family protein [Dermatobacter hominis]|uniref:SRPBCC family protein n=1 Tax=Dermatobacter hominis TaxID=2884263 RepID=UPI001D0FB8CD|nr:SRPBCC family protein [Dermatobacter hominis]UDY34170.1 SRPBCC family protein [Dermatobacter hominis]